jgi:hypothetical protein
LDVPQVPQTFVALSSTSFDDIAIKAKLYSHTYTADYCSILSCRCYSTYSSLTKYSRVFAEKRPLVTMTIPAMLLKGLHVSKYNLYNSVCPVLWIVLLF